MDLTVTMLWVLVIGLAVMMFIQGITRKVDLFSVRNLYLFGFMISVLISTAMALTTEFYYAFRIVDPHRAGKTLALYAYVYIAIYLLSYHRVGASRWLARKIGGRSGNVTVGDSMLVGLAVGLIVASVLVRFVGGQSLALFAISINVSVSLAAAACAIMGWVWGERKLNPLVLLILAAVASIGMMGALTGFFSRRPLISIVAGFTWGAYYRWARHLTPSRLLLAALPLVLVSGGVVAAFTAIRSHETGATEAQTTLKQMSGADVQSGTTNLLTGQASGPAALWLIENFPRSFDYKHLHSLRFMGYWFVPRALWADKPKVLSSEIPTLAKLRGVNRDAFTVPPGVLGYAAAEGGFYAVVIYALFFGQFTRFFDELIRLNPNNPFVILPIGCVIGHLLGLARGDIAIFTDLALVGMLSGFLILYVATLAFGRSQAPAAWGPLQRPAR